MYRSYSVTPTSPVGKIVTSVLPGLERSLSGPEFLHSLTPIAPKEDSPTLAKVKQFQNDVKKWLKEVQTSPATKQAILVFINNRDNKLSKKVTCTEMGNFASGFSLLRMSNREGKIVFRLVSHQIISHGTFGRIKIVFPVLLNNCFSEEPIIQINTGFPMALKILHPRLSEAYYYPIPTPVAYHVFAQQARREYAFTSRPIRLSAPVDADHSPKRPCLETTETTNYKKYICMRLYDAQDLQEYFLNRCELEQWLSYEEALTIIFGVIEAIIKLHRQQIIHSDIKFENILIQSGTLAIYLIDFDFCIGNGESTPILGTKEYLHPELRSQAGKINAKMIATPFNDIYAFAVMLSRISTIVCELTLKKYLATFKDDLRRSSSMECIRAEFIRRFGGVRLPIADEKQFYLGEGNKLLLNLQS